MCLLEVCMFAFIILSSDVFVMASFDDCRALRGCSIVA